MYSCKCVVKQVGGVCRFPKNFKQEEGTLFALACPARQGCDRQVADSAGPRSSPVAKELRRELSIRQVCSYAWPMNVKLQHLQLPRKND